ncbi:MAG TPA: BON domain-containing protein [Chloroflexota bacterium]|nr:BON domain-containing protein [Chloroflexota bacterium]
MARGSLSTQIERELERQAEIHVAAEESDDAVVLSGLVDTPELRATAERLAAALARGKRIDNNIEVMVTRPEIEQDAVDLPERRIGGVEPPPSGHAPEAETRDVPPAGGIAESIADVDNPNTELAPDFTDQPLTTDYQAVSEDTDSGDAVYFPPTDPVVRPATGGNIEVIGGFQATSMDTTEVAPSALDGQPGDEALADAIRRELLEDASTTDLPIEVVVRNRVARLRGRVAGIEDVENAEAVAGRVPGVLEVIEELEVES